MRWQNAHIDDPASACSLGSRSAADRALVDTIMVNTWQLSLEVYSLPARSLYYFQFGCTAGTRQFSQ